MRRLCQFVWLTLQDRVLVEGRSGALGETPAGACSPTVARAQAATVRRQVADFLSCLANFFYNLRRYRGEYILS